MSVFRHHIYKSHKNNISIKNPTRTRSFGRIEALSGLRFWLFKTAVSLPVANSGIITVIATPKLWQNTSLDDTLPEKETTNGRTG